MVTFGMLLTVSAIPQIIVSLGCRKYESRFKRNTGLDGKICDTEEMDLGQASEISCAALCSRSPSCLSVIHDSMSLSCTGKFAINPDVNCSAETGSAYFNKVPLFICYNWTTEDHHAMTFKGEGQVCEEHGNVYGYGDVCVTPGCTCWCCAKN